MRVTCGEPDVALFIHIDARGRHEIRMLGEQREFHARLERLELRRQLIRNDRRFWRRAGLSEGGKRQKSDEEGLHERETSTG